MSLISLNSIETPMRDFCRPTERLLFVSTGVTTLILLFILSLETQAAATLEVDKYGLSCRLNME